VKLLSKLTLYITLSKTAIVILFILLLPALAGNVASTYTDHTLRQQRNRVVNVINRNGIDAYLEGDSSYGSYTMLKEEYISLEKTNSYTPIDTIETSRRVIERDTLDYRILVYAFTYNGQSYVLEAGKTIASVNAYNRPLQRLALYVLVGLVILTLVIDLLFTRVLLRPLGSIIRTKLLNRKFPFRENLEPVHTSTSDFRYLDQSLVALMQQVHEAFEKEREFTSNASHELMTPISILQTKMENMMDDELPPPLLEKLSGMMQTLNRLKKIVRSLLLISRIENDQYQLNDTIVVNDLVNEVATELEDRIRTRDIRLRIELSPDKTVKANRDLFFQLVYNLLNNAIRYNKESGSIRISDVTDQGKYCLIIEDTGIGISPAELPSIFARFKKSTRAGTESHGLGLSIVKSVADYHGWSISVNSTPGKGSVFVVTMQ
jgi:two-component system sensor histidine kinase ArlS